MLFELIEASYTNEAKDTIEIVYNEDTKAIAYYVEVNHQHPDFQDLIKEYSLDKVQETTTEKIKQHYDEIREANKLDLQKLTDELKDNSIVSWLKFVCFLNTFLKKFK